MRQHFLWEVLGSDQALETLKYFEDAADQRHSSSMETNPIGSFGTILLLVIESFAKVLQDPASHLLCA